MRINVVDTVSFNTGSQRTYTPEGFLVAPATVAKTGVQKYLARELGLTKLNPNAIVSVYRPPEEVFAEDYLQSFNGVDVTLTHPKNGRVDSESYKTDSVGVVVGDGVKDGDFVKCDKIIVKDAAAIKQVESGMCQVSAGYGFSLEEKTGKDPETNEHYDYVMHNMRVNHLAIVERARAGAQARILDHDPITGVKKVKIKLSKNREVEIADGAEAVLINDTIEQLQAQLAEKDGATVALKQQVADSAKELEETKKALDDDAVAARVKAVSTTLAAAKQKAGADFTCDSVDVTEIQKQAILKVNPKVALDGQPDAYIKGMFDCMPNKDNKVNANANANDSLNSLAVNLASNVFGGGNKNAQDAELSPTEKFQANSLAKSNHWD